MLWNLLTVLIRWHVHNIKWLCCILWCPETECRSNVTNVPKTHWAHNLISFNQVNLQALLLLCFDFAKLSFRKESLNLLIEINLKSFNLIEWNQIVGPMCFWDICHIWATLWSTVENNYSLQKTKIHLWILQVGHLSPCDFDIYAHFTVWYYIHKWRTNREEAHFCEKSTCLKPEANLGSLWTDYMSRLSS